MTDRQKAKFNSKKSSCQASIMPELPLIRLFRPMILHCLQREVGCCRG